MHLRANQPRTSTSAAAVYSQRKRRLTRIMRWISAKVEPWIVQATSLTLLFALSVVCVCVGCGRKDLGSVVGRVVQDGSPRGFQSPESMSVRFSTESHVPPRMFAATVHPDGAFRVDLNDGTGRGVPEGRYIVTIDTDGLLIKDPKAKEIPELLPNGQPNPDARYPRPGRELKVKLGRASCTVEVLRGKTLELLVDLDQGTIAEQSTAGK